MVEARAGAAAHPEDRGSGQRILGRNKGEI